MPAGVRGHAGTDPPAPPLLPHLLRALHLETDSVEPRAVPGVRDKAPDRGGGGGRTGGGGRRGEAPRDSRSTCRYSSTSGGSFSEGTSRWSPLPRPHPQAPTPNPPMTTHFGRTTSSTTHRPNLPPREYAMPFKINPGCPRWRSRKLHPTRSNLQPREPEVTNYNSCHQVAVE